MTHEHLSMNFWLSPEGANEDPWQLKNLYNIQRYPYKHHDNTVLNDSASENAILDSVALFKSAGGGCLVENSTMGLQRRTNFLKEVSKATGVHIVAGTGFYVDQYIDKLGVKEATSVESMTDHMVKELTIGCVDQTDVKAGFIGEIGITDPMTDVEVRSIQAAAAAQAATGAPVSFHPGRSSDSPFEIMRIFLEAGGKAERMILSHTERTIQDYGKLSEFAKFGTYIQYDLFGIETSFYSYSDKIDFPSDAQRIDALKYLANEEKIEDRILVAQDIHTKHRLEAFGGHGYKHLIAHVAPQMIAKGLSQDQVEKFFISNPANILAY